MSSTKIMDEEDCSFMSMKPAEEGDRQNYINLLYVFWPMISKHLEPKQILPHLIAKLETFRSSAFTDILDKADRGDRRDAIKMILLKLKTSPEENWFQVFKDALKKSGQHYLYKILNLEEVKNEKLWEDVWFESYPVLVHGLIPKQILPKLVQSGTITGPDQEEVLCEVANRGNFHATLKLLSMITLRNNGGYLFHFLNALREEGFINLIDAIDPEFNTAKSNASMQRIIDKGSPSKDSSSKSHQVSRDKTSSFEKKNFSDAAESKKSSPSPNTEMKELNMDTGNKELQCKTFEKDINTDFSATDKNDDNKSGNVINLKEDDESSLCAQSISSQTERKQKETERGSGNQAASNSNTVIYKSGNDLDVDGPNSSRSVDGQSEINYDLHSDRSSSVIATERRSNESQNQLSIDRDNRTMRVKEIATEPFNIPLKRVPPPDAAAAARSPPSTSTRSDTELMFSNFSEADDEETLLASIHKQRLDLRSYQQELAAKGEEGKNCVIVAPTGSGKTHVALAIAQHHLEQCEMEGECKIAFFVPMVALVQQQQRQFLTYMDEHVRVKCVSGEQSMLMTLDHIISQSDVVVMTPQILVNSFRDDGNDDMLYRFSLLIFDECHHTMKEHPYNNIMSRYIDTILSEDEEKIRRLPQIIGLTASPGVGKAKTDASAVEHILELCANLAASEVCTVRDEENLRALARNVNMPNGGVEVVNGRVRDPFFDEISKIMAEIERKVCNYPDLSSIMLESPSFEKVIAPPAARGSEHYTQYLSQLKKEVAKLYEQTKRIFFVSCWQRLEVYNNSLMINADCRTVDALNFIKSQFKELSSHASLSNNETDRWLNGLFNGRILELEEISQHPDSENPKLTYLKNRILRFYADKKDSQGIVFCRTRYMTEALVNWMKGDDGLVKLNPHNLVGAGSTAAKGSVSMTHNKLDDVLKYFKDGRHKIIVATSVAEEGLDVKKCNYVIRYEYVTSDIARVQTRGRARAENATFILITDIGRGLLEREYANKLREEMMEKAIKLLYEMPEESRKSTIKALQQKGKIERDMTLAVKDASARLKEARSHEGDYELRCYKCDALGVFHSDLRTIRESHHVVIDEEFGDRIIVEPHPRPKMIDQFEKKGKLRCKSCDQDWGIQAIYRNIPIFMLKISSFVVYDTLQRRQLYKKWRDAPFKVNELSSDEIKQLCDVYSNLALNTH